MHYISSIQNGPYYICKSCNEVVIKQKDETLH